MIIFYWGLYGYSIRAALTECYLETKRHTIRLKTVNDDQIIMNKQIDEYYTQCTLHLEYI